MKSICKKFLGVGLMLLGLGSWSNAQDFLMQWDFDDGLNATQGDPLEYLGDTEAGTQFGTPATFGLPELPGEGAANIMRFPKTSDQQGYRMPVPTVPNGHPFAVGVNEWTLIMDILFPAESSGKQRAILDAATQLEANTPPGAEFYIGEDNGLGTVGATDGNVTPDTWHRIAFVCDFEELGEQLNLDDTVTVRKYIDGQLVGSWTQKNTIADGGWALNMSGTGYDELFAEYNVSSEVDPPRTELGYVSSIQLRDQALSSGQILALGDPTADGIPLTLPEVPSFVERWIPETGFGNPTTDVGVVINKGSTTIESNSITFSIDGTPFNNPAINEAGDLITVLAADQSFSPASDHTLEVTYTDSKDGERTFFTDLRVPVFFENFEGLTLGPGLEEAAPGEEVWTKTPPDGWVHDDSGVPGIDSPDDDGDGLPDLDGRSEWAGWSFSDKDWWVAADDQNRSFFTLATGTVMVADPDEWDDDDHIANVGNPDVPNLIDNGGTTTYDTFISTPPISLAGLAPESAFLKFDSSWRPEDQQTATITVSFDGGDPIEILRFESVDGPNFKPDSENEEITVLLNNPDGASEAVLTFGLFNAGNDWWWAVDNIIVDAGAVPPVITQQPVGGDVEEGGSLTLSVVAGGGDDFTYQWFKGAGEARTAIDGATNADYVIEEATADDAGFYSVEVTNDAGTTASRTVEVKVLLALGKTIFAENFDELPLGPNVDETVDNEQAWTPTPPAGWTRQDDMPGFETQGIGVTEWKGWSFADPVWWNDIAGQGRNGFTKASGVTAIADGDEWDDIGSPSGQGQMDTWLSTPPISLEGVLEESAILKFDSSWLPDAPQKAVITVAYDGGPEIEVLRWESEQDSANFKADAVNETVTLALNNPAGAGEMVITFAYLDAENDWWWAIDNIVVSGEFPPIFAENFDGLTLGPNVDEIAAGTEVWTDVPPAGWSIQEDMPGLDDPDIGMTEWQGWAFADPAWWVQVDDQERSEFTRGTGVVAIADGDEWDDRGSPGDLGLMNTFLSTPAIGIEGYSPNTLFLRFDSSWRAEDLQKANVTVSYDGGDPLEILRWESDPASANYKADATNEGITIPLNNPEAATEVVITFGYFDAGNDWWWAIDNVEVVEGAAPEPPVIVGQPISKIVSANGSTTLSVGAEGPDLTYQWFRNNVAIEGAVGPNLTINLADPEDAGEYYVEISNGSGTVQSDTVNVEVFSGPVTESLVVHLPFEDSFDDASGSGNNGTPEGTVDFIDGVVGRSISAAFNGENSLSLGTPADLNFGTETDFSVSFWVKYTSTSSDPGFLGNKDWESGGNQGYVFAVSGNGIKWNLGDGSNRADSPGLGTLDDGNWHHYAATFDRSGFGTTFIDGVAVGEPVRIAGVGNLDTPAGLATIIGDDGTGSYGAPDGPRISDAEMDELGIWRRVLTPQEVYFIYQAGTAGFNLADAQVGDTKEGPIAGQWDFDNGDLSATIGEDMTYADGAGGATAQETSFTTMTIAGEEAHVMGFAAAVGEMGYLAPVGGPNGGIAPTKKNQYSLIFDIQWPAAADGTWRSFVQIDAIDNSNDGEFFVNPGNGIGISGNYQGTIEPDTWHRVVFAVDQRTGVNTITKYIDGVMVGTQSAGGFDGRWGLGEIINLLSDNTESEVQAGYVNSIQVRNEVLSPAQVAAMGTPTAPGIPQDIPEGPEPVGISVDEGTVTLTIPTQAGVNYEVQWAASIEGPWQNLGDGIVAGTGEDVVLTDPGVLDNMRFYRIRQVQ